MPVIYRKRENLFERGEREWRVEDDSLVCRMPDGTERRTPWSDVAALQLRFYPTMTKPWLHQVALQTRGGRIAIDNGHFSEIASFDDRTATYAPFLRAMLTQIKVKTPNVRVHFGSRPGAFWAQMIFVSLSLIMLGAVLLFIPLPAPFPLVVVAKLGVIVYGIAMMPRWIAKNLPRDGTIDGAFEQIP